MILWCDGAHDAAENMRRDAALLAAAERGAAPVLRVFQFSPPGITLGRNQTPARELDLARCAAHRMTWAVRPTGGRAILHAEEWTYSLAAARDDAEWGGGPADTYARASDLVRHALVRLGVPAGLVARARGAAPGPRARSGPASPCFASAARHEVVVDDRKLVGSAQCRTARAWLQQGSVLLGEGHARIAEFLALPPAARAAQERSLRAAAGSAARWLGAEPPLERFADALASELGPGTRRIPGAEGAFLLTASGGGLYSPVVLSETRATGRRG